MLMKNEKELPHLVGSSLNYSLTNNLEGLTAT